MKFSSRNYKKCGNSLKNIARPALVSEEHGLGFHHMYAVVRSNVGYHA